MYTLFISDLHLDESEPKNLKRLEHLLNHEARRADALYILGDLFEVWVGDDDDSDFNKKVITLLANYTKSGKACFLMHGNRDFLIKKKFLQKTGCKLLKDPTLINLYNQKILLTHGDLLCTLDHSYQKFRRKVRNPLVQWFLLRKPLAKRKALASSYREGSKDHQKNIADDIMDVDPKTVQQFFKKYHIPIMIHGHTHRPAIHKIKIKQKTCKRIVLNAWHNTGNYLKANSDGTFELIDFN